MAEKSRFVDVQCTITLAIRMHDSALASPRQTFRCWFKVSIRITILMRK
jgi:hypothetical protein